jgi:hypothetical protein
MRLVVDKYGKPRRWSPLAGQQPATQDWRIIDRMMVALEQSELGQRQCAELMGMKRRVFQRWFGYESRPSRTMLQRFAWAVGVPIEQLLDGLP